MADVLTDDQVRSALADLDGWEGSAAEGISKTFAFEDFLGSVAFVNRLAGAAEAANHHPDLAISWNKVTVTFVSHSAGGVTEADLAGARAAEGLAG
ncbi:MAG: 4a-hydroxytetrahydrobiopterin dehydratase [Actinomycetota bacterium]